MDSFDWHSLRSGLDRPIPRVISDLREWLHPHAATDDPVWWTPLGPHEMAQLFERLPWVEARVCAEVAREMLAAAWWQRVGCREANGDATTRVRRALHAQRLALADCGSWIEANRATRDAMDALPPDPQADVPLSWTLDSFLRDPAHVFGLLPGHLPPAPFLERWWQICRARLPLRGVGDEKDALELPVRSLLAAATQTQDPVCRDFALAAFCRRPVADAAEALAESLHDRTVGVRADFVLQALRQLGPQASHALPLVLELVTDGDGDPWVATQLDDTIAALGRDALRDLLRAFGHGPWQHRRRLARILAAIGAPARSVVPFLDRWRRQDPSHKVRDAAAQAITAINGATGG